MTTPDRRGGEYALADLKRVVEGAIATNGALLTAGERTVCSLLLALDGAAGRVYARLASRSGELFRVDALRYEDAGAGVEMLEREGLVHAGLPWSQRICCFTVTELQELCRARGLAVGGRRQDLERRLCGEVVGHPARVIRVANKPLIRRLELLWFRSPRRDRSLLILERLGHFSPAKYEAGTGGRAFATRAELLAFEEAHRAVLEPEEGLQRAASWAPRPAHLRRLDTRRVLAARALERARELERAGEDHRAEELYRRALALPAQPEFAAWRLAQILGRSGRQRQGAELCAHWRQRAPPPEALRLERAGRRLARKARVTWVPARPQKRAPKRRVRLERAGTLGNRPGWGRGVTVEQACVDALAPRRALPAENLLWTTIFGLLFVDLYFLPVEGMLPAPFLCGPLDLGTSEFRGRRPEIEGRLESIRAGRAREVLARNWEARSGQSVTGLAWKAWSQLDLEAVVEGIGPAAATICERLLEEGWASARGLPDLCVLPGPSCKIDAIPATIPGGLMLVEVKGPTDSMRDEQRVWHDRLLRAGVQVELWNVAEPATTRSHCDPPDTAEPRKNAAFATSWGWHDCCFK